MWIIRLQEYVGIGKHAVYSESTHSNFNGVLVAHQAYFGCPGGTCDDSCSKDIAVVVCRI